MVYYQCPECGFKQKSQAKERIKCQRCGHSYLKRKAKRVRKKEDGEKGFFKFKAANED